MNRSSDLTAGGPATFGMRLLIVSLTVLFGAGLVGYWITRGRLGGDVAVSVPDLLFGSTAALIVTGACLEACWRRLRRGAVGPARRLLLATVLMSVVFLGLQIPALVQLLAGHRTAVVEGNPLLGFVFFLILLHSLHVMGGVVVLAAIAGRSRRRPLNPDEDGAAVRLSTRYWHFLELVWAAMFVVFLLT